MDAGALVVWKVLPVVFGGSRVVEYKQFIAWNWHACAELDLLIPANILAVTKIVIGEKGKERSWCSFLYQILPICKDMFLHLCLSYLWFCRLKEHYEQKQTKGLEQLASGMFTLTLRDRNDGYS